MDKKQSCIFFYLEYFHTYSCSCLFQVRLWLIIGVKECRIDLENWPRMVRASRYTGTRSKRKATHAKIQKMLLSIQNNFPSCFSIIQTAEIFEYPDPVDFTTSRTLFTYFMFFQVQVPAWGPISIYKPCRYLLNP